ncbi:MAG: hypothetical protein NTV55_11625 [Planctomycetota bacterium]|nr:hypothetical protein [Planctomycetota bacterium]
MMGPVVGEDCQVLSLSSDTSLGHETDYGQDGCRLDAVAVVKSASASQSA